MKTGHRILWAAPLLVCLCHCSLSENPERYVGIWSNGKSGFDTASFGLRRDGKGYFCAAAVQFTTPARWKTTADGCEITVASPPTNVTLIAKWSSSDVLEVSIPGASKGKFRRVSKDEPPDYEAQREQKLSAESAELSKLWRSDSITVDSLDQLTEKIKALARDQRREISIWVGSQNGSGSVSLLKLSSGFSLDVTYNYAGTKKLSAGSVFKYTKTRPQAVLPTTVYLSEEKAKKLEGWLTGENIKYGVAYFEAKSPWGVDAYYQYCNVMIKDDPEKVTRIVRFVVTEIYDDCKAPYVLRLNWKENPRAPAK